MEVASQGRVSQGQGTGEATVLDTSGFYNTMYNIQKDVVEQQRKKEEEAKKQNATWNALLADMPDVWQADSEYVNNALNEYNDFVIDLKSQGLDPSELDAALSRKMKGLENKVAKAASLAKDNETYSNQQFSILNQDKTGQYNKEYAADWLKRYADPKLTPEERAKMRTESNPFKLNYSMIEFIDDTIPKEEVKDSGRKKITSRNQDAHKAFVVDYITNDPRGREKFESLRKPNEDEFAFAERVSNEGQRRYPAKIDVQPAPQPRTTDKNEFKGGYGTGNWNDKLNISSDSNAPTQWYSSGVNKIKVTRTGTNDDLPPVSGLVDDSGITMESFRPSVFFMGKDGKVSVFGYEYDAEGNPKDDVGKSIDYTKNKAQLESQMFGFDVEKEFNTRRNASTAPAPTSTATGSTKFTGVPTTGKFNGQ